MALETVTRKEWKKQVEDNLLNIEEDLIEKMDTYLALIKINKNYRMDDKTHRIIHQIDFDKGIITYKLGAKRRMGFDYKNKQPGGK